MHPIPEMLNAPGEPIYCLQLLLYDGQGFWLMMKRLSQGRCHWWPKTSDARVPLSAREVMILMWNGDPERAQMAQDWRRVA
jgi:hypothetical protein